ncbi:MAG: hypothetical protein GEV07_15765 [Streptosporangiales bacterium]|nr:hypothetical protein [Streptosporangiales bacterium]
MAVGAYCTYIPEADLQAAVARLRAEAVAKSATGVHRPGDGTAEVVTTQLCRVTEGTLLARHLLERAADEPRPESAELLALVTAAMGSPSNDLPRPLTGVDLAAAAIPVCDEAGAYDTEPTFLTVDLDTTDVDVLNTLHLRPPSAVRYRLAEGARLDWMVRDATADEWQVAVYPQELPELPADAGFVVHRTDAVTGAFAMEPAGSYEEALRLAETFVEHGFPGVAEQAHGFGNPFPELVQIAAVRYPEAGGVELVATELGAARREFLGTPAASYVANVVQGSHDDAVRTGWMLFGLTNLPDDS